MKTPKPDKRRDRVPKSTKTLTTIDHLLTKDGVRAVLENAAAEQGDMTDLICVYMSRDGNVKFITTPIQTERVIYMLDKAKLKVHFYELQAEAVEEGDVDD